MRMPHIHNHHLPPSKNEYPDLQVPVLMAVFKEKSKSLAGYGPKNKAQMHQLFTAILNKHK